MADTDHGSQNDITDSTIEEHGDVHRRFVKLWTERTSGDEGAIALDSAWQPIANLLEGHKGAPVEDADQSLLSEGSEGATERANKASGRRRNETSGLTSPDTATSRRCVPPA